MSPKNKYPSVFFPLCDHRLQCARVCQERVRNDAAAWQRNPDDPLRFQVSLWQPETLPMHHRPVVFHHHPAATSKLALCYAFKLLHASVCRRDMTWGANPSRPCVSAVSFFAEAN
jgi:hypothetical protein